MPHTDTLIDTNPTDQEIATLPRFDEALKESGDHEQGWIAQRILITPEDAADILLDRRMAIERPQTKGTVQKHAASMKRRRWFRLDLLGFGATDRLYPGVAEGIAPLFNGQHRLQAVTVCGMPQVFDIRFNIPWEAYAHVDTVRVREAYASLRWLDGIHLGEVSAQGMWALAKRAIDITVEGRRAQLLGGKQPYPHEQIVEFIQQGIIPIAAEMGWRFRGTAIATPPPVALACYLILTESKVPGKAELLEGFLKKLRVGLFVDGDDPVHALRERLIQEHAERTGDRYYAPRTTHFILRTWNMVVGGELAKLRAQPKEEPFIRPI